MWEAKGTYSSDLGPRAAALVALYPNRVLHPIIAGTPWVGHQSSLGHTLGFENYWTSLLDQFNIVGLTQLV
jgi:hypothetical protein